MRIAVLKELAAGETRVAATPETVKKFIGLGAEVAVESGAGAEASIADADYSAAGAKVGSRADTLKGVQLGWSGDVMPTVRLNTSVWYTDANHSASDDVGASIGIELPLSL